jgi:hypothetical protein
MMDGNDTFLDGGSGLGGDDYTYVEVRMQGLGEDENILTSAPLSTSSFTALTFPQIPRIECRLDIPLLRRPPDREQ